MKAPLKAEEHLKCRAFRPEEAARPAAAVFHSVVSPEHWGRTVMITACK